tara:strand:+ start:108 stop:656 length:549 start_codon:yes stop_codon:yes gene_type:complete
MRENKELDVAIELFNSELEKIKDEKKAQDVVRKAERAKAAAVKELQDAEKNPNLSAEEKAAAKDKWIKADEDLKVVLAGGQPDMSGEDEPANESAEQADETKADTSTQDDGAEQAGETKADTNAQDDGAEPAEIIDEPDVLGCGVPIEQMQETVKEDKPDNQDDSEGSAAVEESEDLSTEDA